MKALSIRQPWAWLIVHGYKDIENREWPTSYRGPILIHTGMSMTTWEYEEAVEIAGDIDPKIIIPAAAELRRGGIIGEVEIVDCVRRSPSPWFFGTYGFCLRNSKPLPFVHVRGQLGIFDVEVER